MHFNQDTITFLSTQSNFPTNKLGIAINTSDVILNVEEKTEILTNPIRVPVDCNPQGYIDVTEIKVNTVSVNGAIQFVTSANLFANNTVPVPNGVNLALPIVYDLMSPLHPQPYVVSDTAPGYDAISFIPDNPIDPINNPSSTATGYFIFRVYPLVEIQVNS